MAKVTGSKDKELMQAQETALATASAQPQLPSFMQNISTDDYGLGTLSQYVIPPRLKVIQKQSGKPFSDLFNTGDVVAVPQMILLADVEKGANGKPTERGAPFYVVPIFFYAEWCLWNPIETKGSLPAIRARSLDPKSSIAAKCRSTDLWFEKCPELPEKNCRYVEHLNFIVVPTQTDLAGTPCVMSFSRGSHKNGSNFAALIRMRKAPLYGCQFECRTAFRSNQKGDWYSIDITNPSGDSGVTPFIMDEALFQKHRDMHIEYRTAHQEGVLRADYDDEEPAPPVDTNAGY